MCMREALVGDYYLIRDSYTAVKSWSSSVGNWS